MNQRISLAIAMDLLRMESFPSSVNQHISLAISMELLSMDSCGGRNSFPTPGCGLHRSAQICKFSTSHQTANIHSTSRQPFASTRFAEENFVDGVVETSSRNHPQNQKHIAINDLCKLCQRCQAVGPGIQIAQLASSANPAQPSSGSKHKAIQQES